MWTTGHLWSLAVEEQFYLLWPLLLVLIGLRGDGRSVFIILVIPLIVAPICRLATCLQLYPAVLHPLFEDYSSLNFFDSLAVGCITAVLLNWRERQILPVLNKLKWESIFLGLILILAPLTMDKIFHGKEAEI